MKARGSILFELLGAFVLIAGLFTSGLFMGRHIERSAWEAKQLAALRQAGIDYDDRLRKANTAAAAAIDEARQARDFATSLTEEITHVRTPLVAVAAARCPAVRDRARAADGGIAVGAQDALAASAADTAPEPRAAPPDAPQGLEPGGGVWLTFSAVRLWNSALAGEQLPAGACRADDPSSTACAARTERALEDAFANHTRNAARCREDRSRLNRLIDVLEQQQRTPRGAPEPKP